MRKTVEEFRAELEQAEDAQSCYGVAKEAIDALEVTKRCLGQETDTVEFVRQRLGYDEHESFNDFIERLVKERRRALARIAELETTLETERTSQTVLLNARIGELLELLSYDGKIAGGGIAYTGETLERYQERAAQSCVRCGRAEGDGVHYVGAGIMQTSGHSFEPSKTPDAQ